MKRKELKWIQKNYWRNLKKINQVKEWGGARKESKLIEKHADQWCKDNGYPLLKSKYIYKGRWKLVDIER